MASRPPSDPNAPKSPDVLEGGLRGPIGGVTRVGPRAFGLAFLVICGLLVAILYGLNRGATTNHPQDAYMSPPPPQPTNDSHFGQNEPIVATDAPSTAAPPLVLPPTAVPNLDDQQNRTAQAPSANQSAADQYELQQREAADRRAADEEAKREALADAALKSPILAGGASGASGQTELAYVGNGGSQSAGAPVAGSGGSGNGAAPATGGRGASSATESRVQSTAYLEGPSGQYAVQPANVVLPEGGNPKDFLQAQRFSPVSKFEVVASSVIPATLITAIDSELPGLVSAQVREDVYDSKSGRYLLIPRGSRLVGLYNNQLQYGQTRILIAWQRLIFPDTTSIDLQNMSGADTQGGAGFGGAVDNHYGKIFGAAILTSVLAAGAELASPESTNVLVNPGAGQVISQSVGQQIAQTGTQIVQKDLSIPPTVHVAPGYPFLVIVDRDIVLPGIYHPQP
jgi:type IV secretory pathway VirB10-like protein